MTNLIGLSGHMQSGKDLTAKIIQYFTSDLYKKNNFTFEQFSIITGNDSWNYCCNWQNKKFADALKDIVCLLIGCTREQLEDTEFKEKELGKEWWYYKLSIHNDIGGIKTQLKPYIGYAEYSDPKHLKELGLEECIVEVIKITPRLLLQLLGTECSRQIIHPNIWINALMSKYMIPEYYNNGELRRHVPQKWIVSDVRFKNECKAIKDRNGILIKINRDTGIKSIHQSETELDSYTDWDYIIDNNGSIENLIEQVKQILLKEEII